MGHSLRKIYSCMGFT